MAWLHTWVGLWFSWLLFAVFLTGSLAVFSEPITHWMTPEHQAAEASAAERQGAPVDRAHRFGLAVDYMARNHAGAGMWEIWPVNRYHDNGLTVYWFDQNGLYADAELDPVTGAELDEHHDEAESRATLGGQHFVDFHYTLHDAGLGLWIVAFATMAMLVALISGVVTHKRIFKDFFTFRANKGQRSWLDAHNTSAVLTLPFLFMIAYTGVVISGATLMPAPVSTTYGEGPQALRVYLAELEGEPMLARSGAAQAVPALEPIVARAESLIGQTARAIVIRNPEDSSMRIGVYGWNEAADTLRNISATTGMAEFTGDGELLRVRPAGEVLGGAAPRTRQVLSDLHMARFGGVAMQWLYFICGMAGAALMGTGAILFMVKRRARHGGEFGAATARVYRLIEGLNVAAMAGLGIACVGYFWANRLLPVTLQDRAAWELRVFFLIWALTLPHAWLCAPRRAWIMQLGLLSALCLLLPLMSYTAVGDHLYAQIARGDWESAGVELSALAFGVLSGWAALRLWRRPATAPSQRIPRANEEAAA